MNSYDYFTNYPIRILIVEDHEDVRLDCVRWLRRKYPQARIDEAGSGNAAGELIKKAAAAGRSYDCAILDLKLPDRVGDFEYPNTKIAQQIIDNFGPDATWFIQWTGHHEDEAIREFQALHDIPNSGPVFEVIPKDDDWPHKMVKFINRLIAERSVGSWLDSSHFKRIRQGSLAVVTSQPEPGLPPVSIPGLIFALREAWPFLRTHRKTQAIDTFKGTDWEIVVEANSIKLVNTRRAQALEDARENAEIFKKLMSAKPE